MRTTTCVVLLFLLFAQWQPLYGTPLSEAIREGKLDEVKKIVTADPGALKRMESSLDKLPLHQAALKNRPDIVKYLLEAGADPKGTCGMYRGTAFHTMYWQDGMSGIVKMLVDKGLDINATDSRGGTILHELSGAIGLSSTIEGEFKELIKLGADINRPTTRGCQYYYDVPDAGGLTPLHLAARMRLGRDIKILLDNGAKIEARDALEMTPLHWACVRRVDKDIALNDLGAVRTLLEAGADINAVDKNGVTPLMAAIQCGHPLSAKLLLEKGADKEKVNKAGNKAIDMARKLGHPFTVLFGCETPEEFAKGCQRNMAKIMEDIQTYNGIGNIKIRDILDRDVRAGGILYKQGIGEFITEERCRFDSEGDLASGGVVVCKLHGRYVPPGETGNGPEPMPTEAKGPETKGPDASPSVGNATRSADSRPPAQPQTPQSEASASAEPGNAGTIKSWIPAPKDDGSDDAGDEE